VKVLVVGAGPTGLVMAHELARFSVKCRLIDKQPERPRTSRAIGILPRTIEFFHLMRVAADFLAAGRHIGAISIFSDAERIARIGLDRLDSPYPFALGLPQDELLEMNPSEHFYRYAIVSTPMPVKDYVAEFRVVDHHDGTCTVVWISDFTVDPKDEAKTVETVRGFLETGLEALKKQQSSNRTKSGGVAAPRTTEPFT
jgi:FAD binding domain/Polyketide cyclase / dehydrase and lipid transport